MSKLAACVVCAVVLVSCSGDDPLYRSEGGEGSGDRERFNDEVEDIRAEVADCFVVEVPGEGRRYRTTVEVHNDSSETRMVTVTVVADLGRGGTGDTFDVPAGTGSAWAVTADEMTTDPVGDVECADYIGGLEVTLGPGGS